MALSRDKKDRVVAEVSELLQASKLTVVARYPGTSVQAMQQLRREARGHGTTVKVIKNRLFKKALGGIEHYKGLDDGPLHGQLLYAFNSEDEVAPAQDLANFAKGQPQIEFVGALTAEGHFLPASDVQALADLPSKQQLRGQLAGVIAAPLSGLVGIMNANLRGVLNALEARAESIS